MLLAAAQVKCKRGICSLHVGAVCVLAQVWHRCSSARDCRAELLANMQGWGDNDRGVSYTFGSDTVTEFLNKHDLDLVCRAHQASTQVALSSQPVCELWLQLQCC